MRSSRLDMVLYASSALFASTMLASALARNRAWAAFALPAYVGGAVASAALVVTAARLGERRLGAARVLVATLVAAGAVLAPLTAEVGRRAARPAQYVASEVVVTEQAAAELARGRNPYAARMDSQELARFPAAVRHFPYLPAMALFGLPRALVPHAAWTDARIFFALATLLAAAIALVQWRAPPGRRLRAAQVLVVLPTGATALVIGGDDLPVLALSLLALVLLERRHRASAAAAVALAGLLKLTAWPRMFALGAARGAGPRRLSPLVLAPAVVAAAVLAAAATSPAAFIENVVLFPEGLTSHRSPATSATLGTFVVGFGRRGVVTWLLLALALLVSAALLAALARLSAAPPATAAWVAAGILLTSILLAPVARSGYLVYPLELAVWARMMRERAPAAEREPALRLARVAEESA